MNNIKGIYAASLSVLNNDLTLNQEFIDLNINYHTCLFKLKSGNPLINKFENDIFEDIINNNNKIELVETIESLLRWIELKKIKKLILPYETVGNEIFKNSSFLNQLSDKKVTYQFYVREWDTNAFSYAKKGFFNFKKNIPYFLKLSNL